MKTVKIQNSYANFLFVSFFISLGLSASLTANSNKAPTTEDFFRHFQIYNCRLSPDGEHISYVLEEGKNTYLVVHNLSTGEESSFIADKDGYGRMNLVEWADPSRLVFVKESGSIYAMNADGSGFETLSQKKFKATFRLTNIISDDPNVGVTTDAFAPRVYRFEGTNLQRPSIYDMMPHDPRNLLISIKDQNLGSVLVKQDAVTGDSELLFEHMGAGVYDWKASKDGRRLAGLEYTQTSIILKVKNSGEQEWTEVDSFDLPSGFVPEGCEPKRHGSQCLFLLDFDYDPNILYIASNLERDKIAIYSYDLEKQSFKDVIADNDFFDLSTWRDELGLKFCPYRKRLMGYSYLEDKTIHVWLDSNFETIQKLIDRALPDKENSLISWTMDSKRFLVLSESSNDPGSYYVFDLEKMDLQRFAERSPFLSESVLSVKEYVTFEARDGYELHGYLSMPKGSSNVRVPLIVYVQRYPWRRFDGKFDSEVQFLSHHGFAVLQVNNRGSGGHGYAHRSASQENFGLVMLNDLIDGAIWAVEEGIAGKERVGIMGHWIGGYLTTSALTQYPEEFSCGVSIDGIYDLEIELTEEGKFPYFWKGLVGEEGAEALYARSPVNNVPKLEDPVLVIYDSDDRESNNHAKRFIKGLKKQKKQFKIVKEPNSESYSEFVRNRAKVHKTVISFFDRHLK